MPIPNQDVWTLTFALNEYTASEVEIMTGLSTDSQRDWRRRGFLPKITGHSRVNIFGAAELYATKMFSDAGKSPGVAYSYAGSVAASLVKTALLFRKDVWVNTDAVEIFNAIPESGRYLTSEERFWKEHPARKRADDEVSDHEKLEWLCDALMRGVGIHDRVSYGGQAVWWPDGYFDVNDYQESRQRSPNEGLLDRVEPRYDGAASVIDIERASFNLVRRSRLPFAEAILEVNPSGIVNRPDRGQDHGTIIIKNTRMAAKSI